MFNYDQFIADSKHHFRSRAVVDNATLSTDSYPRHLIKDQVRRAMAEHLTHEKITERKGEWTTTFEIELLVFTPDEFAGILRQAALDYSFPLQCALSAGDKS